MSDRELILALAARLAAASEVLGQVAERGGAASLMLRYRAALERVAELGGGGAALAREALFPERSA